MFLFVFKVKEYIYHSLDLSEVIGSYRKLSEVIGSYWKLADISSLYGNYRLLTSRARLVNCR